MPRTIWSFLSFLIFLSCITAQNKYRFELNKGEKVNTYELSIYLGAKRVEELSFYSSVDIDSTSIQQTDWNQDGHDDLAIPLKNAAGGTYYHVWLFNSSTQKFQYHKAMTSIRGLQLDSISLEVIGIIDGGWSSEERNRYRLNNETLDHITRTKIKRWAEMIKSDYLFWEARKVYNYQTQIETNDTCIIQIENMENSAIQKFPWGQRSEY